MVGKERRRCLTRRRLGRCDWWVHRHGDWESRWRKLPPASSILAILKYRSNRLLLYTHELLSGLFFLLTRSRYRRKNEKDDDIEQVKYEKAFDYSSFRNGPREYKWAVLICVCTILIAFPPMRKKYKFVEKNILQFSYVIKIFKL